MIYYYFKKWQFLFKGFEYIILNFTMKTTTVLIENIFLKGLIYQYLFRNLQRVRLISIKTLCKHSSKFNLKYSSLNRCLLVSGDTNVYQFSCYRFQYTQKMLQISKVVILINAFIICISHSICTYIKCIFKQTNMFTYRACKANSMPKHDNLRFQ